MDNFASLDTPGDPGGVKVVELSGMKPKSADSVTVVHDTAEQGTNAIGQLALNSGMQTYQILSNDEVCTPSLSSILLAVLCI